MNIIVVENLVKSYKQKLKTIKALSGMSFDVEEGIICGFLGPNGAGKSTTLKIMMNFIKADKGRVLINSKEWTKPEVRYKVGFMPENPPYLDSLTGRELLLLSAKMHDVEYKKVKNKADELLELFDLTESANKKLRNYSKGMIQRIGFAASLIIEPKILILDEPMSGLDPIGRYKFKNVIKDAQSNGTTIFFSSHIISDIEDICDKVIIVNQGKVVKKVDEMTLKVFSLEGYRVFINKSYDSDYFSSKHLGKGVEIIDIKKDMLERVIYELRKEDIKIINIEPVKKDLEKLFIELVGKQA